MVGEEREGGRKIARQEGKEGGREEEMGEREGASKIREGGWEGGREAGLLSQPVLHIALSPSLGLILTTVNQHGTAAKLCDL